MRFSLVVLHGIHHGAGVVEVRTGLAVLVPFQHIVGKRLVLVPFHKIGFGDDASEPGLTLLGSLLHQRRAVVHDVVVVFLVETAFEDIVLSQSTEALIRLDKAEPLLCHVELPSVVSNISQMVAGGRSQAALGSGLNLEQIINRIVVTPVGIGAVSTAEIQVQKIRGIQPGFAHLREHRGSCGIVFFCKKAGGIFIPYPVPQDGLGELVVVFGVEAGIVGIVSLDGAQHGISPGHRIPQRLENSPCLLV